jgi:hypothetical protein
MPRYKGLTIGQEMAHRDKVRSTIGAAISVLGTGIPIGGQRSSLWHIPNQRLELPVHYRETLNVLGDAWWGTRDHLPESIALAKAAMPGKPMIQEWDYDGYLGGTPAGVYWGDEMLYRFRILKENGIAAQVVHCKPADLLLYADVFRAAGEIMRNAGQEVQVVV